MLRLDAVLLAGVGVLTVHQGAYTLTALVGAESSIAHGHIQIAWLLGSLGALAALARAIVRSVRARTQATISEIALCGWIAGGYLTLEQAERLWDGHGALTLFFEPVFWLGLALAPLVAFVLGRSFRSIETAIRSFVHARPQVPRSRDRGTTTTSQADQIIVGPPLLHTAPRRGPPSMLFA